MNFKNLYESAAAKTKLDFLDHIISENKDLQSAFVSFANSMTHEPAGITYQRFTEIISETLEYYKDRFEELDTENPDWGNYQPSTLGYIEDWEQYQEASEQEVGEIFDEFKSKAVDAILKQNMDELTALLIGLYEATLDAEIEDPIDTFGDVNEYLLDEHNRIMQEVNEKLKLSALQDSTINATCKLFFEYSEKEYPGNEHFVAYFEDFLLAISGKSNHPGKILALLDQSKVERQFVPRLTLLLNHKAGNTKEWLQSARQFYRLNNDVARQLLEHYFNKNKTEFRDLANELFAKEPGYWALQLKKYVSAKDDNALFVKVFYRLVLDNKSMEDYHKLRQHLSTEKLEKLIKEISYDKPFMVKILAAEKRDAEIKEIVELNPDHWDYTDLISPILEVYPQFCFNQISGKVSKTIKTERGRSVYRRIVGLLKLADSIPGYKDKNRLLARELYHNKPPLPALRDELRNGGLV